MIIFFEKIPPTSDSKSATKPEATDDEQRNRVIAKNEASIVALTFKANPHLEVAGAAPGGPAPAPAR